MALPPAHITIKRRRDEEPVEALYLEPKRRRPGQSWRLISDKTTPAETASWSPTISARRIPAVTVQETIPQVPIVRSTLTDKDLDNGQFPPFGSLQRPSSEIRKLAPVSRGPESSCISSTQEFAKKGAGASSPHLESRKFHFKRSTLTLTSRTGVQKHKRSRRNDLPLFVEKSKAKRHSKSTSRILIVDDDAQYRTSVTVSTVVKSDQPIPRKRPIASVAEQKWRIDNWSKPTASGSDTKGTAKTAQSIEEPSSQWDYDSLALAEQLDHVVLQELHPRVEETKATRRISQPRVRPQPPKPRNSIEQPYAADSSEGEESISDKGDDGIYVFDTYVRFVEPSIGASVASSAADIDLLQAMDHSKIGILIIAEQDQEEWETYAEGDQDSDKDWNSEEEDENAEDFYGNDYPEEEVNSEDEFDRGAYKYRKNASDEEEYDLDVNGSSDEAEAQDSWKRNVGDVLGQGENPQNL